MDSVTDDRLFVAQVVAATEEQWFAPGTDGPPIETERTYQIEQLLFGAMDEDDAYRIVCDWLANDAFSDADHDGCGDSTRYFGVGIHQLEELTWMDEFLTAVHDLYGVSLPHFNMEDVDANGVPIIREKDELEVFRVRRRC